MIGPETKPTVKLIGNDGNAFSIMGRVKQALKRAGADKEYIDEYLSEATSGIMTICWWSAWDMWMWSSWEIQCAKLVVKCSVRR